MWIYDCFFFTYVCKFLLKNSSFAKFLYAAFALKVDLNIILKYPFLLYLMKLVRNVRKNYIKSSKHLCRVFIHVHIEPLILIFEQNFPHIWQIILQYTISNHVLRNETYCTKHIAVKNISISSLSVLFTLYHNYRYHVLKIIF